MKVLDLFSGLGMFSYAARNVFQENFKSAGFVEIDKYCQKQILDFFEGATIYDNIETFEPGEENKADIITAGFPCTDISIASPRKFEQKSDRVHGERSGLWKHIIRVSRRIRPRYIILENSTNIVHSSGISSIIKELSAQRYCLWWSCISAQEFGLPHLRRRWYAVAFNTDIFGFNEIQIFNRIFEQELHKTRTKAYKRLESKFGRLHSVQTFAEDYAKFLTMDNEYSTKENQDDLKAVGNSIVPDIAELLFSCIKILEQHNEQ